MATYNELGNLPSLVARLRELFPHASILVVDDNSPDGTGQWCLDYQSQDPRFTVEIRKGQRGLGSATRWGLQYGMTQQFEWMATMDADWSHDPQDLLRIFTDATGSSDHDRGVWIGSRYVPGAEIVGWHRLRRWGSRWINRFGRRRLGLPVYDISSALRLYRAEALQSIEWTRLTENGYGYLEELLRALQEANIPCRELPITFSPRRSGRSKMRWRDVWGVVRQILRGRRR
ncbi:MAG TPA: glycosyltransferase [Pirellulaceae bacterium]|nr:glycosyltransferase [Pirellulaceae bacterium]